MGKRGRSFFGQAVVIGPLFVSSPLSALTVAMPYLPALKRCLSRRVVAKGLDRDPRLRCSRPITST